VGNGDIFHEGAQVLGLDGMGWDGMGRLIGENEKMEVYWGEDEVCGKRRRRRRRY